MSLSSLLIHTVDIKTVTETKSARGAVTTGTATTKASAASCRVQQMDDKAILAYGRLGQPVSHKVFFDTDYSLTVSDYLVFGSLRLDVVSVAAKYGSDGTSPHHWEVLTQRRPI